MTITDNGFDQFYTKQLIIDLPNTISGDQVGSINPQSLGSGQVNNVIRLGKNGGFLLLDENNNAIGYFGHRGGLNV